MVTSEFAEPMNELIDIGDGFKAALTTYNLATETAIDDPSIIRYTAVMYFTPEASPINDTIIEVPMEPCPQEYIPPAVHTFTNTTYYCIKKRHPLYNLSFLVGDSTSQFMEYRISKCTNDSDSLFF